MKNVILGVLIVLLTCSCNNNSRFFLISYEIGAKEIDGVRGDLGVKVEGGFPSKNQLDSTISNYYLPKQRKCYGDLIIRSIFEFKTSQDYEDFFKDRPRGKLIKKDSCGCFCDSALQLGGQLHFSLVQ